MNEKKYIIYLDILGFTELAVEMVEGTPFEEDRIRQDYLSDPLEKKIKEIKRERIQISKGISEIEGSDNYVLIVDDIQTAFELVGKLTTIKIPHNDHEFIPFEVALGTKKIDEDIEVKPINRKEIINFLHEDVINPYRSYYKNKNDETIKETFVLFTQAFFDDLEPLDKKYCERISHKNKTFFVADLEKIQQRARVFEFLEKIGYAGSKWYGRVDEVYVPPSEYEEMARTLNEKRILFITGTPEYGKTYTAVRLMWEFYNRGYEPRWIVGGETAERIEVRRKLEDIGAVLKPGRIIYFEDPFGTTRYEGREGLERKIGTIVDNIRQVEGVYVIITSREEVFKEFEKQKLSAAELQEFEKKLNIKKPSYNYEKRKEILLKWAGEKNCKWLGTKKLKGLVLESIKDKKALPTPLSIWEFAGDTFDIEKDDELKEKIEEKSKETAKAFAEEIKNMTDDKILFLSFLFISDYFEIGFVRGMYQELVKELHLKDAWEFDRVHNWFKDDKIGVVDGHMRFSHPSYSEALEHLLVEAGCPTRINKEIFSRLLLKLSENKEVTLYVARVVAYNFHKLPGNVGDLLFKLSESDETAWYVAEALLYNFDKLPDDVRNKLLLKLSEKEEATWRVAKTIMYSFDKLPEDLRNRLLLNLSEKNAIVKNITKAVTDDPNKTPATVRNFLSKLAEKSEASKNVAEVIACNYDKLPDGVSNFLSKLAENDEAARAVIGGVANDPEKLNNKVLRILELAEKNEATMDVVRAIWGNFNEIPCDLRNLLFKELSENDEAAWTFRWALQFKFSEMNWTAGYVAETVARNYDKLPDNVRNLLFKLSENDEAAWGVAEALENNFDNLPEHVRDELLLKLSEKNEVSGVVAKIIANNFDKLPMRVRTVKRTE